MRKVTKKWTQRDGEKIRICDMDDDHLMNTIKMLRRTHGAQLLQAYSASSGLTGEMAIYESDRIIDHMESVESLHPLFDDLCNEAFRRMLNTRSSRGTAKEVRRR